MAYTQELMETLTSSLSCSRNPPHAHQAINKGSLMLVKLQLKISSVMERSFRQGKFILHLKATEVLLKLLGSQLEASSYSSTYNWRPPRAYQVAAEGLPTTLKTMLECKIGVFDNFYTSTLISYPSAILAFTLTISCIAHYFFEKKPLQGLGSGYCCTIDSEITILPLPFKHVEA